MLSWVFLLIGGACEVVFVVMMKLSGGFKKLNYSLLTIFFQILSFYCLSHALKEIQIGIGYAVWAGIGAIGSVLVGMVLFNESRDFKKILFILMVVIGIVGLKLAS